MMNARCPGGQQQGSFRQAATGRSFFMMAQGARQPQSLPERLAFILSCFRGSEGHEPKTQGESHVFAATLGHRKHAGTQFPLKHNVIGNSDTESCYGRSGTTAGTLAGANEPCSKCTLSTAQPAPEPSTVLLRKGTESLQENSKKDSAATSGLQPSCQDVGRGLRAITAVPVAGLDLQNRTPTPGMLLSLRHLHMALATMDLFQQVSPFTTESPSGETRSASVDFMGLGHADMTNSDSSGPVSVSSFHPQLHVVSATKLSEEVQDLQLLGRGGYGMVMTGNWKQEGRVAVKVLLSDEDKWMESCYKEAVLSRMLAHPNILQTYDFQVAVLVPADITRAKASWEQQQRQQMRANQAEAGDAMSTSPLHMIADTRADSFELLPTVCATGIDAAGLPRAGTSPTATDLWQVLFMLGARPGQYVTLIIMEYAEVGTLQRAIAAGSFRESARLSRWAALRSLLVTAKEIAGGMCLLHSFKIIHGDLSATNVMLRCSRIDKRGFVAKVADFGLSKVTLSGVTRTGDMAGQPQYLAPECLDYEARLASDVFAFGVLLYEMACGRKAYSEYQPAQILAGRLAGDLELDWPADVPPELRALAERCMQQDPEARPSFREVVEDLRRQDMEAKAQHRQCTMSRRYTADGMSPAAALVASAAAYANANGMVYGLGAPRVPSPLGPYRAHALAHGHGAAPSAVSVLAAAAAAAAVGVNSSSGLPSPASQAALRRGCGGNVPEPPGNFSTAASCASMLPCHNALRHSYTTGSSGLGMPSVGILPGAGLSTPGDGAISPAFSAIRSNLPSAAATLLATGATLTTTTSTDVSDFMAVGTQSLSSRVLTCQTSSETSGRLCTGTPTLPSVPAVTVVPVLPLYPSVANIAGGAVALEPIASGEVHVVERERINDYGL